MLHIPSSKRELLDQIQDVIFFGITSSKHFDQFVKGANNKRWNKFLEEWSKALSNVVYNDIQIYEHMYVPTHGKNEIDYSDSYVENEAKFTKITLLKRIKELADKYGMRKLALQGYKKAMQSVFATLPLAGVPKCQAPNERKSLKIRTNVSVSGVIIEPRDHPFLNHVISSVVTELPNVRPIHVFHGERLVLNQKIKMLVHQGDIRMHHLTKNNFTPDEYSRLMTSEEFWGCFSTDKILVFQTDSVVCKNENRYQLLQFLDFDYIGALKSVLQHGNGGFSLRDRKLSLQCSTPGGYDITWEDVYFSTCIQLYGGKVAGKVDQMKFATEDFYNDRSLGAHKVNVGLKNKNDLTLFRKTCPNYVAEMS
eukprot:g4649.t1